MSEIYEKIRAAREAQERQKNPPKTKSTQNYPTTPSVDSAKLERERRNRQTQITNSLNIAGTLGEVARAVNGEVVHVGLTNDPWPYTDTPVIVDRYEVRFNHQGNGKDHTYNKVQVSIQDGDVIVGSIHTTGGSPGSQIIQSGEKFHEKLIDAARYPDREWSQNEKERFKRGEEESHKEAMRRAKEQRDLENFNG